MVIALVILNWNGANDTLACLSSISRLHLPSGVKLDLIVVDNASSDNSVRRLANHKGITFLRNAQNLGYAGGNNVGIHFALTRSPDFIWILNPDIQVDPNCLINLLAFAKSHPRADILAPKIYFFPGSEYHSRRYKKSDRGKVILYAGGKINWAMGLGKHIGVDEVDTGQFSTSRVTQFASGACLFAKASVFRALGGFDERYFLYLEDLDFSLRANQKGFRVYFVPGAFAWHRNASSSQVGGPLQDYYFTRNRLLFVTTHGGPRLQFALIKESIKFLFSGRRWQKMGVVDFYLRRFGQGSFSPTKNA